MILLNALCDLAFSQTQTLKLADEQHSSILNIK